MLTIIDYQLGNLGSIVNMYKYLGIEVNVSNDPNELLHANKLILPGVGNFKAAMERLVDLNLVELIHEHVVSSGKPLLGICLGMQLLFDESEEGNCKGLSLIPGAVRRLKSDETNKVPNMGWNTINIRKDSRIIDDFEQNDRFYFVHSYYAEPESESDILLTAQHTNEYCCGVERNSIFGFQFHPEKSHKFGLKIFKNFALL